MKKALIILFAVLAVLFFVRFVLGGDEDAWICDKRTGEWVKHGNPSLGKPSENCLNQEASSNQEDICKTKTGKEMSYKKARTIAEVKCKEGSLLEAHFCNPNSGTWWIDFVPNEPKEGCNPACVVFVDNSEVEINWRCTGLIQQAQ